MSTEQKKIRIALIYGGTSGEHPISCATAGAVMSALDTERYEIISIGITRSGAWVPGSTNPAELQLNAAATEVAEQESRIVFSPGDGNQEILLISPAANGEKKITSLGKVDVVFPLLHGPFGEDGTIQGLLEMANIPYVGCGVFASAAGMDKDFMKIILRAAGIPVGPYVAVPYQRWMQERKAVLAEAAALEFPLYVKPARAGSSLGISRIENLEQLPAAITEAQRHDPKVIIEQGIAGREIECAVLGASNGKPARASLPGEIVLNSEAAQFYDFDHKYVQVQDLVMQVPAAIPEAVQEQIRETAVATFAAFGGEGLARVDFFYTPGGEIFVNEINTMPGFTPVSMYPVMWKNTGIPYADLVQELIDLALARGTGLH
ncbi:MAG: D-alanine--D-alanine ligase [Actinomycetaceae bacterium]|nr:D-alanine--D-alanine ligase [Actinomycetaceae bacterium]